MATDFLYDNAPLIEVIVEVRWVTQKLEALPDAAIDPHFNEFHNQFRKVAQENGFSHVQTLLPEKLPIEFMHHKPHSRYRVGEGQWPLFQIGPGIMTINIVPPYKGWTAFKDIIENGLDMLFSSYPFSDKTLTFEVIHLRYIDGFIKKHGFDRYSDFIGDKFKVVNQIPREIIDNYTSEDSEVVTKSETRLDLSKPPGAVGFIKVSPGTSHKEKAAIVELVVASTPTTSPQDRDGISSWLDQAHLTVRHWFQLLTSDELKNSMGPREEFEVQ